MMTPDAIHVLRKSKAKLVSSDSKSKAKLATHQYIPCAQDDSWTSSALDEVGSIIQYFKQVFGM